MPLYGQPPTSGDGVSQYWFMQPSTSTTKSLNTLEFAGVGSHELLNGCDELTF